MKNKYRHPIPLLVLIVIIAATAGCGNTKEQQLAVYAVEEQMYDALSKSVEDIDAFASMGEISHDDAVEHLNLLKEIDVSSCPESVQSAWRYFIASQTTYVEKLRAYLDTNPDEDSNAYMTKLNELAQSLNEASKQLNEAFQKVKDDR